MVPSVSTGGGEEVKSTAPRLWGCHRAPNSPFHHIYMKPLGKEMIHLDPMPLRSCPNV